MNKKNRGGRPSIEFTDKIRKKIRLMSGNGLRNSDIAKAIGISEKSLTNHCQNDLDSGRGNVRGKIAAIAVKLLKRFENEVLTGPYVTLLIFWLKTQCGFRGADFQVMPDEEAAPIDLSKLTNDELKQFKRYVSLCRSTGNANTD